jgi:peroxiredoxin
VAVYNDYKEKGFEVLGVSLDKSKEDWLKAIEQDQLTWTHVSDLKSWKNAVAQQYEVKSVPSSFLLDKDGVIIAKNLRGDELRAKIAELLD